MRRRTLLAGPALLAGCASPPATAPDAEPAPLQLPPGGRAYRLDAEASRLRIVAFRAGPAARLGHHHLIEAGAASGRLWLPAQGGFAGAQGEIELPLQALRLDEPAWRREAGGEFDERPLSAEDIAATRRNLLALLQAEAHPRVRLRLLRLAGTPPHAVASLQLQIAGRRSTHSLALDWRSEGEGLRIAGRLPLSLQALGLQAPSVLGGLLAVADEVVLDALLSFRRKGE